MIDDKATVGGRWSDDAINNILDLYQEEWIRIDKVNLKRKHWIHIRNEHHRQMSLNLRRKEEHIKGKFEKLKPEWRVEKNSREEAHVEKDLRGIGLSKLCLRYSLDEQKEKDFLVE